LADSSLVHKLVLLSGNLSHLSNIFTVFSKHEEELADWFILNQSVEP